MAQTKRKRRRKHRGTQAGTIERPARTNARSSSATKQAPKREGGRRSERPERLAQPPTWKGAAQRAAIAAALFGVLVVVVFGRPVEAGALGAAAAFLLYVPTTYYLDRFFYQRRQRREAAGEKPGQKHGKASGRTERGRKASAPADHGGKGPGS